MGRKISKEVIEFTGNNNDVLQVIDAVNYHVDSVVVAPMTHVAFIIENGALREKISGGSTSLFRNVKAGCLFGLFRRKKKIDTHSMKVIYISKTARLKILWGTDINQRISYVEPTSGLDVSVGAFGSMEVRVRDAEKFYLELVAADDDYSLEKLQARIRDLTVNETLRAVKQVFTLRRPAYNKFEYEKEEIQDRVGLQLSDKYVGEFGFEVTNFLIGNLNVDTESAKVLKNRNVEDSTFDREELVYDREKGAERRRKIDMVDDIEIDDKLYSAELNRKREQEEYIRKNRHEDEDRAWAREDKKEDRAMAREDKKLESEERKGSMYFDAVKAAGWDGNPEKTVSGINGSHHCTVCGAAYKPGAKYCPDCGATLPSETIQTKCLRCGEQVPWGTKFCPVCGEKIENKR